VEAGEGRLVRSLGGGRRGVAGGGASRSADGGSGQ
jgi:hypothetical protein